MCIDFEHVLCIHLRETYMSEPFLYKTGSKEAGQKWTEVAEKLNCYDLFREMPRDQRSVRDQFNKLMGNYKRKRSMEEKSSGINPDPPTENEEVLEEIIEMIQSTPMKNPSVDSKNEEKKRKDALATREIAMTTWKKAAKRSEEHVEDEESSDDDENLREQPKPARKRRSCTDPIKYLVQKSAKESELKKEELELKRQELELKAEQQKQQFQLQQLQLQQMMETQQSTQNLFVAVIEKLSK